MSALLTVRLRYEQDVVDARSRARQLAGLLGYSAQDQTRVATAVSELARNALMYAGGGRVEYRLDQPAQMLRVQVSDQGPGIPHLDDVLSGRYVSPSGLGMGLRGSRRLMDDFEVDSTPGRGTVVRLAKRLPVQGAGRPTAASLSAALAQRDAPNPVQELQLQNQELLATLEELARREEQLATLNRELEDTNRGVVALYTELEEKAIRLREASQVKSMFLSYVSHEFRTPLHSILGLTRMLLGHHDGALSGEQDRQLTLLRSSADELLGMVNDLLDLTRAESGKSEVYLDAFAVSQTLSTLRALFQPLLTGTRVNLVFEEVGELPPLYSDEGKLHQILRNFISNALKFTERGEVRVTARLLDDPAWIEFSVRDSGPGIALEDQHRLFQEFSQVGKPPKQNTRGSGLGLSLSKRLAELLGGQVGAESTVGVGSRFWAVLPVRTPAPADPVTGSAP